MQRYSCSWSVSAACATAPRTSSGFSRANSGSRRRQLRRSCRWATATRGGVPIAAANHPVRSDRSNGRVARPARRQRSARQVGRLSGCSRNGQCRVQPPVGSAFQPTLETEGLTPALDNRMCTHQMHADGFERYTRMRNRSCWSAAIAGRRSSRHPAAGAETGTRSGSQPLRGASTGEAASTHSVRRPASRRSLVKLMNLEQDLGAVNETDFDDAGVASFSMPTRGSWLVSVVWTRRLANASTRTSKRRSRASRSASRPTYRH